MGTQMTMQALGPTVMMEGNFAMKPLPSLPSPTLTNPDLVLPDEPRRFSSLNSPPRYVRGGRPPSPGYLRDTTSRNSRERSGSGGSAIAMATPKKEKRGLMSRKMMLLRSRTASSGMQVTDATPVQNRHEEYGSAYGSSPTLMDVGNLAPEQPETRRISSGGSSLGSDELASLPQFLAKYDIKDTTTTDNGSEGDETVAQQDESHVDYSSLEAQRKQQEEDEQTSALLSQRAEQILANAKKRLNLMEGNLRGARDLVQPLTAANLKRATSVGSSYVTPTRSYGARYRTRYDGYDHESPSQHRLQPQASAPHLAHDYQGHWRGHSEIELPERPYTAMESSPIVASGRMPNKAQDPGWSNALRGSRSYDSLGSLRQPTQDTAYAKNSPDPNLEPLLEDDGPYHAVSTSSQWSGPEHDGPSITRSLSRTEDLRGQMSSLKGKISNLRDRAREDSLRRQSLQNLREPSPFNNATDNAPEFFYTSSPSYGQPALDTNAGVGWTSQKNSPNTPQSANKEWEHQEVVTGSRNAFAEEEQRMQQQRGRASVRATSRQTNEPVPVNEDHRKRVPQANHKRTPSGTAIVQSSKHRYSHHQQHSSIDSTGAPLTRSTVAPTKAPMVDDGRSEAGDTVYEDAESEIQPSVVAHEDREDAFDYKNFFLHSAMAAYERRDSTSSDGSATSTETAKGPTATGAPVDDIDDGDDEFDEGIDMYPPPSPETPERLREIERNLHKRTISNESVDTLATFATATEGRDSPDQFTQPPTPLNWPIAVAATISRPNSRPNSRPSTAVQVKQPSPIARSDSSSERADSGVGGLPQRSYSSQSSKRPNVRALGGIKPGYSPTPAVASPPMSPRMLVDPATVAVKALLEPSDRQLGLKDKALLFGLVESLTKVCHRLQEGQETDLGSRALRRRLDEARRILDGGERPGSS